MHSAISWVDKRPLSLVAGARTVRMGWLVGVFLLERSLACVQGRVSVRARLGVCVRGWVCACEAGCVRARLGVCISNTMGLGVSLC
jgi:hypothetical protein